MEKFATQKIWLSQENLRSTQIQSGLRTQIAFTYDHYSAPQCPLPIQKKTHKYRFAVLP